MSIRKSGRRVAVLALGAAVTLALASPALAAPPDDAVSPGGSADIGASVDIEALGELYMVVAADSMTLEEEGSDDQVRRFVGDLPEVTVVDTRSAANVEASMWYVLGTASAFTADGVAPIGAENVGWAPFTEESYDGVVSPGSEVFPILDVDQAPDNVGLVGQELLLISGEPLSAAIPGEYTAGADIFLHTSADVAGGLYTGTLTLSLFEE